MFNLSLTPFSTMTTEMNQARVKLPISTSTHPRTSPPARPSSSGEVQLQRQLTMGDGVDFRCLPDLLVRSEPALRIHQVRREEGVDQRRLS